MNGSIFKSVTKSYTKNYAIGLVKKLPYFIFTIKIFFKIVWYINIFKFIKVA